jgi:hypothetical protein
MNVQIITNMRFFARLFYSLECATRCNTVQHGATCCVAKSKKVQRNATLVFRQCCMLHFDRGFCCIKGVNNYTFVLTGKVLTNVQIITNWTGKTLVWLNVQIFTRLVN